LGLCAWLARQASREWSDCGGDVERSFTKDSFLTSVDALLGYRKLAGTAARYYFENKHHPLAAEPRPNADRRHPTGIIRFPSTTSVTRRAG